MSYILGYVVADGCIIKRKDRKNSYIFNITSKDKGHLFKIKRKLKSNHPISTKYNSQKMPCFQIQICDKEICKDLIDLGIFPRKTHNLGLINVSEKYFPDFVRGFFDGDGTVFIYDVNHTPQIKGKFMSYNYLFIEDLNKRICRELSITQKNIHIEIPVRQDQTLIRYSICFYVDDCEKLAKFMYGNDPVLYLSRKRRIFEKWKSIERRRYIKQNY